MTDTISPRLETSETAGLMRFSTTLVGTLDHESIELRGVGTIDENEGLTEGTFEIVALPDHVDPHSLGAFLFTGYPNACRTHETGFKNPFSGGSYNYTRQYSFQRSQQRATLDVTCDVDTATNSLESVFRIDGEMPSLEKVRGVSPIYELWAPTTNSIEGQFNVAWIEQATDAVIETATACSRYEPVDTSVLHGRVQHRYLKLGSFMDDSGRLVVQQESHLVA